MERPDPIVSGWPVDVELGHGHRLRYSAFDGLRFGATIEHPRADGKYPKDDGSPGLCWSGVYFDTPEVRAVLAGQRTFWQVDSVEPLTLSPSILCLECRDHGWIRDGKWVVG